MPRGCRIMDTMDRLQGYVFSSTAHDVVVDCGNPMTIPQVNATIGHVVVRVKKPGAMYLGLEHSETKRMNGYVIANLASEIKNALLRGDFNPTLDTSIGDASPVPSKWQVTFDANGGRLPPTDETTLTRTYLNQERLGELPTVEYWYNHQENDFTGNDEFVGWFTEPDGGSQVSEDTKVTENATYYAHWNKNPN